MTTPTDEAERSQEFMLNRVRKLLAKAEADGVTPAEAEALTERAAELMQRFNISKAMAEHREHKHVKPVQRDFQVAAPYATAKVHLLSAVAAGFRCTVLYSGGGTWTTAHVYGFEDDIDMVMILFTSLLLQAASGAKHIRATQDRGWETVNRTKGARRAYLLGFAYSIRKRLEAALNAAKQTDESGTSGSKELVLASREVAVRAIVPQARRVSMAPRNAAAYNRGREDGERANLHDRAEVKNSGRALSR